MFFNRLQFTIKMIIFFPIWLIYHYMVFMPMVRKEAEIAGMGYDEYINHRYTVRARDLKPLVEALSGVD